MAYVIINDPIGGLTSTVRCDNQNTAIRQYATVTGGYQNTSSGKYSFVGGGQNNTSSCYNSVVGGGFLNTSSGFCSGILGGSLNVANGEFSFIGGGKNNTASDSLSVVAGGTFNVSTCECTVVGGGENNTVNSLYGIIGGGLNNTSIADFSIVGGGCNNANLGSSSVVGGGNSNTSVSNFSVVAGGTRNQNYGTYATISGGICNKAYLDGVTIGGGSFNTAIKYNSVIAGGYGNTVSGYGSTVSGGYTNTVIGDCSFAISNNSVIMGDRIAVIGGSGITGTTDDTVYVPYLNIGNISTGTTVNSLGIDSNGLVIVGNDFTGNTPSLSEVISIGNETGSDIVMTNGTLIKSNLESRFFIGLSSGLSWLAWAYGVPVVMISNFTKKQNEFECFRVGNPYVCNGCFNMFPNIKSRCPIFLDTERENECHRSITPEMVINKINEAITFTNS